MSQSLSKISGLPTGADAAVLLNTIKGGGTKDAYVKAMNDQTPYSFNVAQNPYEIWDGRYNQLRPRGATFLHPEGIDAAWQKYQPTVQDMQNRPQWQQGLLGFFAQMDG